MYWYILVCLVLLMERTCLICSYKNARFDIFVNDEISTLKHFWESTGLCPPLPHSDAKTYFLSDDMVQNLKLISSVPHNGLKQVRIHWLLEMVKREATGSSYDFSNLDKLIHLLHQNQLKPGFEIMGNPSNFYSNFENAIEVVEFKKLVTLLATRYIKMFGEDYVSKWNFETWNEPDHKDFDNITMSVTGFLNYYDACSEGLKEASKNLIFGGPGGSCRDRSYSKRCWALFQHCVNGTNFFTGEVGNRIDYISFHKKGGGKSETILNAELKTIAQIDTSTPSLASIAIYNDEADPLVGWSRPQWWRADVTYAAIIVKIILQHQLQIMANKSRAKIKYALLSNDNAFLSYNPNFFTQRTLNARFQINNTNPNHVHFVRKPALTVMGMLSKLGYKQLRTTKLNYTLGGISSICSYPSCQALEISTLLYNSDDTEPTTENNVTYITLFYHNVNKLNSFYNSISKKSVMDIRVVTCSMDNVLTNPYKQWVLYGHPSSPNSEQFTVMHEHEGPLCTDPSAITLDEQGRIVEKVSLQLPGLLLHHICWKPDEIFNEPTNLLVYNITTGQVLITWQDTQIRSKCIKTYVIHYASARQPGKYVTLNKYKVIFNSFVYINEKNDVYGSYRVQVLDFWERYGRLSDVVKYG